MPIGCPFFFVEIRLLRRCGLLLLLAHALQLFVDLLRGFDSVGVVWLGGVGRGCSGRPAWIDGRDDGIALERCGRRRLHGLAGSLVGLRSIVEGGRVWIGRSGATLAGSEDQFRGRASVMVDEDHVAACAVQQLGENLIWAIRAVLAEDSLIGDSAGDLHPGLGGDLTKDLVEAGVVGGD